MLAARSGGLDLQGWLQGCLSARGVSFCQVCTLASGRGLCSCQGVVSEVLNYKLGFISHNNPVMTSCRGRPALRCISPTPPGTLFLVVMLDSCAMHAKFHSARMDIFACMWRALLPLTGTCCRVLQACVEFLDPRVASAGQPDAAPVPGQPGRISLSVDALAVALRVLNSQLASGSLPSEMASQVGK